MEQIGGMLEGAQTLCLIFFCLHVSSLMPPDFPLAHLSSLGLQSAPKPTDHPLSTKPCPATPGSYLFCGEGKLARARGRMRSFSHLYDMKFRAPAHPRPGH